MPGRGPGQHSALEGGTVLRARVGPGGGVVFCCTRSPAHPPGARRACAGVHTVSLVWPSARGTAPRRAGATHPEPWVAWAADRCRTEVSSQVHTDAHSRFWCAVGNGPGVHFPVSGTRGYAVAPGEGGRDRRAAQREPGGQPGFPRRAPRTREGGGGGVRARGLRGARSVWREQGEREWPGTCLACRSPTLHLTLATQRDPSGVEWL